MNRLTILFLVSCLICVYANASAQDQKTEQEIKAHGKAVRSAFRNGDIDKISSLHHPKVMKALGYNDVKNGRAEVISGLTGLLEAYELEFVENHIESILIEGDLAIEQTLFAIRGTPKGEGDSFMFSGRTMVTYIRYDESPTGWATIREIIQPAP